MPVTWVLTTPTITAPGVARAGSVNAPDSPIDVGVPRYFVQQDFLDQMDRLFPEWYLGPLKASNGSGYELLQAYARLFEKISRSIGEFQTLSTLEFSSGGRNALASVQFYRPTLASGVFTVKAGTIVSTSRSGLQYETTVDVTFGAGDFFVAVLAVALGQDSNYNQPGPIVTPDGTLLPGEIDTVVLPNLDPPFAEAAIQVRQLATAYGGCAPVLDELGNDRGIPRAAGEADISYKKRARALPDTVSPAAIKRQLDAIFYPASLHYDLMETWENRFQSCWNTPIGGPTHAIFGKLVNFAYNDPRTDRFIPRWMGEQNHRGAMVLVVPTFPTLADRGMAYNDPTLLPDKTRGASAWNAPVGDSASLSGVWNGDDDSGANSRARFLHTTYDLLRSVKGGGIDVAFVPAEATEVLPGAPYP